VPRPPATASLQDLVDAFGEQGVRYRVDRVVELVERGLDRRRRRSKREAADARAERDAFWPVAAARERGARRRPVADDAIRRTPTEVPKERRKRERALPPPLCGDEAQKCHWAKELEVSREEFDEMSPGDFKRTWDARNERLRAGGVFDRLDELWQRLGQKRIDSMTPTEVIAGVRHLPKKPNDQLPTPEAAESGRDVTDGPAP
jgi:hypothetical protein